MARSVRPVADDDFLRLIFREIIFPNRLSYFDFNSSNSTEYVETLR